MKGVSELPSTISVFLMRLSYGALLAALSAFKLRCGGRRSSSLQNCPALLRANTVLAACKQPSRLEGFDSIHKWLSGKMQEELGL